MPSESCMRRSRLDPKRGMNPHLRNLNESWGGRGNQIMLFCVDYWQASTDHHAEYVYAAFGTSTRLSNHWCPAFESFSTSSHMNPKSQYMKVIPMAKSIHRYLCNSVSWDSYVSFSLGLQCKWLSKVVETNSLSCQYRWILGSKSIYGFRQLSSCLRWNTRVSPETLRNRVVQATNGSNIVETQNR